MESSDDDALFVHAEIVSTDPVRGEIAKVADLRRCTECAEDYGRELSADVAITGEIRRVSRLILNIDVCVKDLGSGKAKQAGAAELARHRGVGLGKSLEGARLLVRAPRRCLSGASTGEETH